MSNWLGLTRLDPIQDVIPLKPNHRQCVCKCNDGAKSKHLLWIIAICNYFLWSCTGFFFFPFIHSIIISFSLFRFWSLFGVYPQLPWITMRLRRIKPFWNGFLLLLLHRKYTRYANGRAYIRLRVLRTELKWRDVWLSMFSLIKSRSNSSNSIAQSYTYTCVFGFWLCI